MVTRSEIEAAARNPNLASRLAGGPEAYETAGTELVWEDGAESTAAGILTSAIPCLSDQLKDMVVARYAHRMSYADYGRSIGRTRERARQLEAKALRVLRQIVGGEAAARLKECLVVRPIKDGPADPAWLSVPEASQLTGLTRSHILVLGRRGRLVKRVNPARRCAVQISRESLRRYVLGDQSGPGCRRRGIWKGEEVAHE